MILVSLKSDPGVPRLKILPQPHPTSVRVKARSLHWALQDLASSRSPTSGPATASWLTLPQPQEPELVLDHTGNVHGHLSDSVLLFPSAWKTCPYTYAPDCLLPPSWWSDITLQMRPPWPPNYSCKPPPAFPDPPALLSLYVIYSWEVCSLSPLQNINWMRAGTFVYFIHCWLPHA